MCKFRTGWQWDIKKMLDIHRALASPLIKLGRACAQPEKLRSRSRSRSSFWRPCSRGQNVLNAAQFCAHFKILYRYQSSIWRILSKPLKNDISYPNNPIKGLHSFYRSILCLKMVPLWAQKWAQICPPIMDFFCAPVQRSSMRIWAALTKALSIDRFRLDQKTSSPFSPFT